MTYKISIAIGSEGSWISLLNGSADQPAINLPNLHTLETLGEWLKNPDSFPATYWKDAELPAANREIYFDMATGKLVLHHPVKSACQFFDPSSEESLAKLVRVLKSLAEKHYDPENKTINQQQPLPLPTAEDFARRTIYANIGIPDGVEGYRPHKPKPRYQQSAASKVRSQEIVKTLLADFGFE